MTTPERFLPEPLLINLGNAAARYVRVQLAQPNYLHLEEVELWGGEGACRASAIYGGRNLLSRSEVPILKYTGLFRSILRFIIHAYKYRPPVCRRNRIRAPIRDIT